jgi:hypothetical protein
LNVTEIPNSIIRYKVLSNERNSILGGTTSGVKLNSHFDGSEQNKANLMLMSLDKKFYNVDCFDSNFLSNYPVMKKYILFYLLNRQNTTKKELALVKRILILKKT